MAILAFPTVYCDAAEFGLQSNTQNSRSELNGTIQTQALPGDIWTCNETFSNRQGADARKLKAFIASLRGQAGRFWKSDPLYVRAGTALGASLVKGAGQTGLTLDIDGCTANQAGFLLTGDYFQIGNELKMLTADIASSATGTATLQFTPPLRAIPADNAVIITANPSCVMQLKDAGQAKWQASQAFIYNLSMAYEEALEIT